MVKKKNIKNKKLIYLFVFFFILAVISLINFKQSHFITCKSELEIQDKISKRSSQNSKSDKFLISSNKEDLVEQQKTISIEDANEKREKL